MHCPFCTHKQTEVYNSRNSRGQTRVWRRRRCKNCEQPFTTYETANLSFLLVRDRNGTVQPYQRLKLQRSLWHALGGQDEQIDDVESLTCTVETELLKQGVTELTTPDVARTVLAVLKRYDPAAFLRYLSQRNDFASMEQLRQELQEL